MTEPQEIELNKLKEQVYKISNTVNEMNHKTDGIYYALVGNDLSKDGGLVQQIKDMKNRQELFETEMEIRIKKLEDAFTRWKGIAFGLFIAGGVIGYLLQIIINQFIKH